MANKRKQFTPEFKQSAIDFVNAHPEMTVLQCANHLEIGLSTLQRWKREAKENPGQPVPFVGSGNYSSEIEKENIHLQKELRDTQEALKILKKSHQHSGKLTQTLYQLVAQEHDAGIRFCVSKVLHILNLSTSGYYEFLKREPSRQALHKEEMKKQIQDIYDESHQNYGAPKIAKVLQKEGNPISERTVGTYMREMGIKAQWIKKSTKTTVDSCFDTNLRNVLKREFSPERPNAVWCSDITYISTRLSGFVYLTSIMDLYSRKIIAWTLSKTLEVEEVLKCLEKARSIRNLDDPIVIHTDRGIHYTCGLYREMTQGMKRSYSKKGTPYDNAYIESFHSLIKRE